MPSALVFEEKEGKRESVKDTDTGFTWQELRKYNSKANAHVAVRGKVYNVSSFMDRHPGGLDQILCAAGRDITQVFECYHPTSAKKVLEKFYVGKLVSNEHPVFPEPGTFISVLRERVENFFKEENIDPKVDYWMYIRYVVFIVTAIFGWFGLMYFKNSWPLGILSACIYGYFTALVTMTCTHDASHFSVTHKPWVWQMVGCVHDFFNGASMFSWTYQHILGHHLYTNIDGHDPDILTSAPQLPDFRRIKLNQRWTPHYFFQHIYCPFVYCLLGIKTRLQDFFIIYRMTNTVISMNKPTAFQYFRFFGGKSFHVLFRFIVPLYFMPAWKMLILNVIGEMIGSWWIALIFQISHMNSEVDWPLPDENNIMHKDWAELQVTSSQDFATDSWFWTVFTGSINHQTAHHLFPGIIQSHYVKITPIIAQACKEFNINYHCVNSPMAAFALHINHLRRLGQELIHSGTVEKKE